MRRALAVVASTRAAAGVYADSTGPLIEAWMTGRGFEASTVVLPDGDDVGEALSSAVAQGLDLVVTSGGTGVTPTDVTPEQTAPLLERVLPGFAEELRRRGVAAAGASALLSRGLAGVAGRTLIVNLPGSPGGVRDGLALLSELVDHALDQIGGGDHGRGGGQHD